MPSHESAELLSIGKFARLGGVSMKALRIYARLGLLPPASVESHSGYRRYAPRQLAQLHRILLLKSAGLSLHEIGENLVRRDAASLSRIRQALLSRAEDIQRQLALLDAEIRLAPSSGNAPVPVLIKHVPRVRVLAARRRIDSYDQADAMLRELGRHTPASDRLAAGAVWHDCGARSRIIDCEAFWILNSRTRVAAQELAPATVASILHEGEESGVRASYETARRWIADHRYKIAGPNREIYLGTLTEIQFPIERKN